MKVFDLKKMKSYPYAQRHKNVFYKAGEFKARIIGLPAGGKMPQCKMESHVIFFVIKGRAEVKVGRKKKEIKAGDMLISPPGNFSMETRKGVKIAGVQVAVKSGTK